MDRGLIPMVPLAGQVLAQVLYVLVSQTVVVLPDTIKTRPCLIWAGTIH